MPLAARVASHAAVAAAVAYALAVPVADERGGELLLVAAITGAVAGSRVAADRFGGLVQPAAPSRRALWRLAVSIVVTSLALAALADGAGWSLGPIDALLVTSGALASAGLAGAAASRAAARPQRVLVVGSGVVARHLAASIGRARRGRVVGLIDDGRLPARSPSITLPVLGDIGDVGTVIADHEIDLVVFSFVGTDDVELSACVAACRAAGAQVAVVSRLFEGLHGDLSLGRIEGFPVVAAEATRPGRLTDAAGRITDVALAAALIVLTSPLWLLLALAIVLDSRGGVFYRARRVGRNGVHFRMLKFRKMAADAAGPALTLADDDRFTRMGRFLAHSKLDELPQLWNVLRGEMSFVGPRPEDARYVAVQAEAYEKILTVRPGITGLSQIGFRREFEHFVGPDFEQYYLSELLPLKLSIDAYYVDHRSWHGDMRILLWTAMAMTRGGELDIDSLAPHVAFRRPAALRPTSEASARRP